MGQPLSQVGAKMTHVPYRGGLQAPYNDLVGGRLDLQVITFSNAQPMLKTDKLRAGDILGALTGGRAAALERAGYENRRQHHGDRDHGDGRLGLEPALGPIAG